MIHSLGQMGVAAHFQTVYGLIAVKPVPCWDVLLR